MSAIEHDVRTARALAAFLAMVYLTYVIQYIAPTAHLRRWAARAWWNLFRLGPGWPQPRPARVETAMDILAAADGRAARR